MGVRYLSREDVALVSEKHPKWGKAYDKLKADLQEAERKLGLHVDQGYEIFRELRRERDLEKLLAKGWRRLPAPSEWRVVMLDDYGRHALLVDVSSRDNRPRKVNILTGRLVGATVLADPIVESSVLIATLGIEDRIITSMRAYLVVAPAPAGEPKGPSAPAARKAKKPILSSAGVQSHDDEDDEDDEELTKARAQKRPRAPLFDDGDDGEEDDGDPPPPTRGSVVFNYTEDEGEEDDGDEELRLAAAEEDDEED